MALETKQIAEYLGLKEDDLKDDASFKQAFEKDFIKQSNITEENESVKKILGKTFGTLENEIKKVAKSFELEIDFSADDLKDKKVTDKLKFVISEYDSKQKSIIADLTEKAGKGNDEKVKELQEKYDKVLSKANDYQSLLKAQTGEFDTYKQSAETEKKNVKLDFFKAQELNKVKFKADINEFEKEGYLSKIEKTYKFDLDETGKAIILDKEGKRIPNPKVNGSFMEIADVLQEEAVKGKLYQLNPDNGQRRTTTATTTQTTTATNPHTGRKVASRL